MCVCRACTKKKSFVGCICGIRVRKREPQRERERKERGQKEKVNILQLPQKKNFYKEEECKPHLWNDGVSESKKRGSHKRVYYCGKLSNSRSSHHYIHVCYYHCQFFLSFFLFFMFLSLHIILIERIFFSFAFFILSISVRFIHSLL